MSKAFKSSEGMTKSGGQGVVPTSLLNEDRNWQMIVWRFDKELNELIKDAKTKVRESILDQVKTKWNDNIKRY